LQKRPIIFEEPTERSHPIPAFENIILIISKSSSDFENINMIFSKAGLNILFSKYRMSYEYQARLPGKKIPNIQKIPNISGVVISYGNLSRKETFGNIY